MLTLSQQVGGYNTEPRGQVGSQSFPLMHGYQMGDGLTAPGPHLPKGAGQLCPSPPRNKGKSRSLVGCGLSPAGVP